jgi:hypothetical protein
MWTILFEGPGVKAVTDYVRLSVNGDTTATSMFQGDTLEWAANCAVGAAVRWSVWIDLNSNSTLDTLTDKAITDFVTKDGDTVSNDGPPDTNPVPDGWIVSPPLQLGIAPAHYFFRAADLSDSTSAYRGIEATPLPSPPNKFTGTVTIPGHTPPDPFLSYLWVEASEDAPDGNFWSGLTTTTGSYEISVGASGTGVLFQISVPDLPGFVTPTPQSMVASGVIANVNFAYQLPTDSVYGQISDEHGTPIQASIEVYAQWRSGPPTNKRITTSTGSYTLYYAASDVGEWDLGLYWDGLVPTYLIPNNYTFTCGGSGSLEHDFVCFTADTVVYAKITELGGPPAHSYRLRAWSQDTLGWTTGVSGTGSGNVVPLHVSSLGALWDVTIDVWDDNYPIPPGWALEAGTQGTVAPGDTAVFNFISGHMVRDTFKVDAGDPQPVWQRTSVFISGSEGYYNGVPDNGGVFTVYVDTGTYTLFPHANGYLASPAFRDVYIQGDTVGGLGFTLNHANAVIRGQISGPGLTLGPGIWMQTSTGPWPTGYSVGTYVDAATGNYQFEVCDGNWTIYPPFFPGYEPLPSVLVSVGNSPDTIIQHFVYSPAVGIADDGTLPQMFELQQNYPNPFNPETEIGFSLPLACNVKLEIFNVMGRRVAVLVDRPMDAGRHSVSWDGNAFPSGLYLYRLEAGAFVDTKKLLLLK